MDSMYNRISAIQNQIEDLSLRHGGFTQKMEEIIAKKMSEAIKEIEGMAAGNENLNPTQTRGTSDADMAYPAAAVSTPIFHEKRILSYSSRLGASSERIKCFYMIYDCWDDDLPGSYTCIEMNKETAETTPRTISPASDTKRPHAVLLNFTAVAVGPTIYMIGGYCKAGYCPADPDIYDLGHGHADVRSFNTLRPEDGWRDEAYMCIPRVKPTAVVIDGMIYVFGGSDSGTPEDDDYGEWFDPKTNKWSRFFAAGCHPSFSCIQAPYLGSDGATRILVHSDHQNRDTLFAYPLGSREWEIVSRDFDNCSRPGAIVGNIIYAIRGDEEGKIKNPLHGYHLIHKRWFPVELPVIDAGNTKIFTRTAFVFACGSDRLCLVWYHSGHGKDVCMECMELKLNENDTTGSDGILRPNVTVTKVSSTYFCVPNAICRRSILAL